MSDLPDSDKTYLWQCQDCGLEYRDEEACNGCPSCDSDNVVQLGEVDEYGNDV